MSCPHSWSLAPHVSHSAALPQHTWAPQSQQQRSVALKAVSTTVLKSACHDLRPGRDAAARQHLVTLTTQCSLDRWPRFLQQAESWAGPVSVAVYIPAPEQTSAADACLQLLQHWAASHAAAHPQQRLHVAALFADHYAWEGASVLEEAAGEWVGFNMHGFEGTVTAIQCSCGGARRGEGLGATATHAAVASKPTMRLPSHVCIHLQQSIA